MSDPESGTFTTIAETQGVPPDPKKIVRRWIAELDISSKGEKDWRKEASDIYDRYRGKESKKNSFNILWANTEILRPALYNSLPNPDVRRRFRDADPLGKAMSEVMKRGLEYTLQEYDYDAIFARCVLDLLLPGRAVMRLRYKPTIAGEVLNWECVMPEHVQYDDFRHGAGKTWPEVTWVGFRHRMTKDELTEQFREEIAEKVPLDSLEGDDNNEKNEQDEVKNSFKTAEIWEIWDKTQKQVLFISTGYSEEPCQVLDDPLGIDNFWPMPEPMYAVEDSSCLTPIPIWNLYREQAEELDRISGRINKIIQAVKFRFIYDATITEMKQILEAGDNDGIPATDVSAMIERGGLEKGIWVWPVGVIAQVLVQLYEGRERTKAVIYELTGISDVVRGSSKASETLGAQQLKAQYAGVRLGKMQSMVQKFIRNSVKLAGDIIAEKFQQSTLQQMTQLPYPTQQQVQMQYQQQQMQWQQVAMQAQQTGQQPPPPPQPPQVITWETVIASLRDNPTRSYKVDIETDSTIQALVDRDMTALGQVGQAVNMIITGMGPLVEKGVMPMEAMKELIGAVARRAKLGNAVEDAFDKIQEPKQPVQDPKAAEKAQQEIQQAQQEIQQKQQDLQKQENDLAFNQQKLNMDVQQKNAELQQNETQAKMNIKQAQDAAVMDAQRKQMDIEKAASELELLIAGIDQKLKSTASEAQKAGDMQTQETAQQSSEQVQAAVQKIIEALSAPKKIDLVRDGMGRTTGAVSAPVQQPMVQ